MWKHFQALPSTDRRQHLPPCTLVSGAPGHCPHAALLSVPRPLGSVCQQLGELRAVQPSSQGAFLSWIPSFPGRLQLGLVLPAHKVAEDTPAPSVTDISYFPLSVPPAVFPLCPRAVWGRREGGKEGWDVSIPSAEPGKLPPSPAGAGKVSLQLLLLVPVRERVTR